MKKKTIILVDGENISAKNADMIVTVGNRLGAAAERKVCHHRKDRGTRALFLPAVQTFLFPANTGF